jgi:deazaflavin-dependent oxidoreductase (nitroreductase family)
MNRKNQQVIDEFRSNGGIVLVTPPHGPILLLHTTGARTGRELVTPLIYRREGGAYVVAASMGGWKTHPAWYHNLVANAGAWVEVGRDAVPVHAEVASGKQRERLFALHCESYPQFAYYQGKTKRMIPVVTLRLCDTTRLSQGLLASYSAARRRNSDLASTESGSLLNVAP